METAEKGVAGNRLFFLGLKKGQLLSAREDGSDLRILVDNLTGHPDGIGVDIEHNHIYFTMMGDYIDPDTKTAPHNDGSIMRVNMDGSNLRAIIPTGQTVTPKQLQLDLENKKIYWCDREGMRVMRADLDGRNIEILVQAGHSNDDARDQRNWCVGIAIDHQHGHIYWTQKGPSKGGEGRILRAGLSIPKGERPDKRSDIELLLDHLPEPIDLLLSKKSRTLYWTDRGAPPRGNTLNSISLDRLGKAEHDSDILEGGFKEAIGVAADWDGKKFFITDLSGYVYVSALDGFNKKTLLSGLTSLTGIEVAKV